MGVLYLSVTSRTPVNTRNGGGETGKQTGPWVAWTRRAK